MTMSSIESKAYSVLFPVLLDLEMNDDVRRFLGSGGRSLLFGETAQEYVSGKNEREPPGLGDAGKVAGVYRCGN